MQKERIDIEDVCSRFYQVIPVVLHVDVHIPEKPHTPNNIGEALKGSTETIV